MSIFYWIPWSPAPMGGIKQARRHVETLVDAGWDAHILISGKFNQPWFNSKVPVARVREHRFSGLLSRLGHKRNSIDWLSSTTPPEVYIEDLRGWRDLNANDVLVFPEFYGHHLVPCKFGSRMVVFNQNAHYTFGVSAYSEKLPELIYPENFLGVLAVSDHVRDYLAFTYPNLQVLMTPNGVDSRSFYPERRKKRQIAFMPRKLPGTIIQVLQILHSRGSLEGWKLCPIDGVGEDEVARRLRESAIFLSTCHDEGFGLPPLEAGACGCIVVGYCGQAARQFMLPEYCYPVDQGDVLALAKMMEEVMAQYVADPTRILDQAFRFAEFIQSNYSLDKERAAALDAWATLCDPSTQRRHERAPHA